ncbi:hypothetical protein LENED_001645 [Lentinula edodes]|uniref:Uncharacterized protein n=1 Tax=Lentinula edodes TaxID=5353 RepID=A0A1Q3DYR7_LENED|nr:hypothetical protein LENED_001645 [Lentinula edodes]
MTIFFQFHPAVAPRDKWFDPGLTRINDNIRGTVHKRKTLEGSCKFHTMIVSASLFHLDDLLAISMLRKHFCFLFVAALSRCSHISFNHRDQGASSVSTKFRQSESFQESNGRAFLNQPFPTRIRLSLISGEDKTSLSLILKKCSTILDRPRDQIVIENQHWKT